MLLKGTVTTAVYVICCKIFPSRLPDGGALFLLLFYIPCGVLLVIFRIFFGLQLLLIMSILPKESLVKR